MPQSAGVNIAIAVSKRLTPITIAAVLVTSIATANAAILEGKAGAMGGSSNALAAFMYEIYEVDGQDMGSVFDPERVYVERSVASLL